MTGRHPTGALDKTRNLWVNDSPDRLQHLFRLPCPIINMRTCSTFLLPTIYERAVLSPPQVRHVIYHKGIEEDFDIASPMAYGGLGSEQYKAICPLNKAGADLACIMFTTVPPHIVFRSLLWSAGHPRIRALLVAQRMALVLQSNTHHHSLFTYKRQC